MENRNIIEESNRLLAGFLYPYAEEVVASALGTDSATELKVRLGCDYYTLMILFTKDYGALSYHKSWSSLIPVVAKIMESPEGAKESPMWLAYYHLESTLSLCDITNTYSACIDYIKAYSENRK